MINKARCIAPTLAAIAMVLAAHVVAQDYERAPTFWGG